MLAKLGLGYITYVEALVRLALRKVIVSKNLLSDARIAPKMKKATLKFYAQQSKHLVERKFAEVFMQDKELVNRCFVTGNQKSGTSAIAALVAMAAGKSHCIDIFVKMGFIERDLLDGGCTFESFLKRAKIYFNKDIIKEPEFIFFLDELDQFYPGQRYVNVIRSPFDNIRSILNRLSLTANDAAKIKEGKHFIFDYPLWNLIVDTKRMPYVGDNLFELLVSRWNYAVNVRPPKTAIQFESVRYEDFMIDKKAFVNQLCSDLGFDVRLDIAKYVDVSFQPKGTPVLKEQFFSFEQIDYIYENCSRGMKRYGYQ